MLDSKSSNQNCLSIGKISHATLRLLTIWDQRHSNVLTLHLIATVTNQICLSVPNSPCNVHQYNKNFIQQLYFFHITNFKGKDNLEEKVHDLRKKNTTPNERILWRTGTFLCRSIKCLQLKITPQHWKSGQHYLMKMSHFPHIIYQH